MKPKTKSELMAKWAIHPDQLKKEREVEAVRKAMDDAHAVMQDGLTRYVKKKTKPANIWFDAKKVLPKKDKEVLVKREKFGIEIAFLSYDGLWQEHNEYIVLGDVTHWAYLPEPPKEV
jgi:hypothetical protein